jgi:hypothetical protein
MLVVTRTRGLGGGEPEVALDEEELEALELDELELDELETDALEESDAPVAGAAAPVAPCGEVGDSACAAAPAAPAASSATATQFIVRRRARRESSLINSASPVGGLTAMVTLSR